MAAVFIAVALGELGEPAPMWQYAEVAHAEAERLHLPYPLMVIDATIVTWEAQAGRPDRAQELVRSVSEQSRQLRVTQAELGEVGAVVASQIWDGRAGEAAAITGALDIGYLPTTAATVALLHRAGRSEEALAFAASHRVDLEPDNWFSLINWALAAETALVTGDAALAASAYDLLAPFAGYTTSGRAPGSARSTPSSAWPRPPSATSCWPRGTPTTPPGCARSGRSRWSRAGCATSETGTGSELRPRGGTPPARDGRTRAG